MRLKAIIAMGVLCQIISDNLYAEAAEAERKGIKTVNFGEEYGTTPSHSVSNRLAHYCEEKGIDVHAENIGTSMSIDEINNALEDGKTVVFRAEGFNLEYENGKIYNENIGAHEMTITGITSDGRYEVSTWGKKLYFDPENNASDMKSDGFFTIEYNLSDE